MATVGSKEWEKYNRELKILRAKQKAGGLLRAELERLTWLEERFGEAAEHSRIQVEDPTQAGPTTKTTEDHYATDVSQDLLEEAHKYMPQKKWERDAPKQKAKFEASDPRRGQATFRQEGLSSFAIELTEDMRDLTQPETQADSDWGDPDFLQQEETKPVNGQNPFAVALDEDLQASLSNLDEEESAVPEAGAKTFEANLDDLGDQTNIEQTLSAQPLPAQAHDLLSRAAQDQHLEQDQQSIGQATTHQVDETDNTLDFGLIRQALEYAEEHDLIDDDQSAFSVDEQGREVEDYDLPQSKGLPLARLKLKPTSTSEEPLDELQDDLADELEILDSGEFESIESAETKPIEPAQIKPELEPLPIEELEQIPELITDYRSDHETHPTNQQEQDLLPALDDDIPGDSHEFEVPLWIEPASAGGSNEAPSLGEDREPTQPSSAPSDSEQLADLWESEDPKRDFFDHRYQNQAENMLPSLGLAPADKDAGQEPISSAQPNQATPTQGSPRRSNTLMASLFDDPVDNSPALDDLFGEQQTQGPPEPSIRKSESTDIIRKRKPHKESPFKGPRRVTVHFKDGFNRRGTMRELEPAAAQFHLEPKPNTNEQPERFDALALKAIFVMLPRGNSYPTKTGTQCKITMIDGRSLEGFTDDYDPSQYAFTLLPKTDRGNIERVLVFLDAIKNIYFE